MLKINLPYSSSKNHGVDPRYVWLCVSFEFCCTIWPQVCSHCLALTPSDLKEIPLEQGLREPTQRQAWWAKRRYLLQWTLTSQTTCCLIPYIYLLSYKTLTFKFLTWNAKYETLHSNWTLKTICMLVSNQMERIKDRSRTHWNVPTRNGQQSINLE